jgi:hypothetical protein
MMRVVGGHPSGGHEPAKEGEMLHTVMIVLHATAGVVAFAAGSFALFPPRAEQRATQLFWVYLVSLGLLVVFLVGAMAAHWQELGTTERVIFSALLVLGLYMVRRALMAQGLLRRRGEAWRVPYMEHIGFTLISLWDGFVIVLAIDLGAPGWLVAVLAVLGVVAGNRALHWAEGTAQATG